MMKFIFDRLKEPSTWNAIALILGLFAGMSTIAEWITVNTGVLVAFFGALCALIAAFNPEAAMRLLQKDK